MGGTLATLGIALLVLGLLTAALAPRLAAALGEVLRPTVHPARRAPAEARMQALIAGQSEARGRAQRLHRGLRIGGGGAALLGAALALGGAVLVLVQL